LEEVVMAAGGYWIDSRLAGGHGRLILISSLWFSVRPSFCLFVWTHDWIAASKSNQEFCRVGIDAFSICSFVELALETDRFEVEQLHGCCSGLPDAFLSIRY
jgi:hypothetical protein